MKLAVVVSLLAVVVSGCATVVVDGYPLREGWWNKSSQLLKTRAAFELQCPQDQVKLTVLAEGGVTVGATGCGRRGVYVFSQATMGHVLNSPIESAVPEGK